MSQHADAVKMGKETLAMKQDLAKKQIEAYMTDGKENFISSNSRLKISRYGGNAH